MPLNGNAEEAGTALVLPDRDHGTSERRTQDESHGADAKGKAEQHEVIEGGGVRKDVEPEGAEIDRVAGESAQSVVAAGQRTPLKGDVIEHLAESDRHHREVDAASSHDQGAENRAANAAEQHPENERKRRAGRQEFERQPGAIGPKSEPGGVAERQHAGKTKQEIHRHRREPEHEYPGCKRGIAAERYHPIGGEDQKSPDRRKDDQLAGVLGAQLIIPSSPNSPRGPNSNRTAIVM